MAAPIILKTAVGAKAWRQPLEQAAAKQARSFVLEFEDVAPIFRAFAPMAREQAFDVSEMAIVTALQAIAYGKPIVILPVTLFARFQHHTLIGRAHDRPSSPDGLRDKRVAVRAYSQTTGMWIRGILQNEYGVKPDSMKWITQEGAHVSEYKDPPWVERTDPKHKLTDLLRGKQADAAIFGNDLPDDPEFAPIIDRPKEAAQAWYEKHRVVPVNHLVVVRRDLVNNHPDVLRELWSVLQAARPAQAGAIDMMPIGIEAMRPAVELALRYCEQQELLPRKLRVDEAFADAARLLGSQPA